MAPARLLPLTVLSVAAFTGCPENTLTALRPGFDIRWPVDNGFVEGDLEHSALAFGTVTTGDSSQFDISILSTGNQDLTVHEIYLADVTFDEEGNLASEQIVVEDLELHLNAVGGQIPDGSAYVFPVRFSPLFGTPIPEHRHLGVKHELNWDPEDLEPTGEGVLYVPFAGVGDGDPIPDIASVPGEKDYGVLLLGDDQVSQMFDITNAGPGLLTTGNITLGGANPEHFVLVVDGASNSSYAFGETRIIEVAYNPQAQGVHSAEVVIETNDPDEQPFIIPLFGEANPEQLGKGPVAVCGPDIISAPFQVEQLDGSGSYDPDGLTLSYLWVFQPPAGSATYLSSYTSPTPTTQTQLDLAGTYTGTLTVTNTAGQESVPCTQTIEAVPNENFRIELFWQDPDDYDLHLLSAGTPAPVPRTDGDCYFANCVGWYPNWSDPGASDDDPSLDLDDIPGTGPENINIVDPGVGTYAGCYTVFVHDYPGTVDNYNNNPGTVNIYLNGILAQTFTFAMAGEDQDYYIAKIQWPQGVITPCNGLSGCPSSCP
jgi:hypothetical protein